MTCTEVQVSEKSLTRVKPWITDDEIFYMSQSNKILGRSRTTTPLLEEIKHISSSSIQMSNFLFWHLHIKYQISLFGNLFSPLLYALMGSDNLHNCQ